MIQKGAGRWCGYIYLKGSRGFMKNIYIPDTKADTVCALRGKSAPDECIKG